MKFSVIAFASYMILMAYGQCTAQSANTLWYKQPARYFEEALVLGNGKMGATVFGGAPREKIFLNDATLWSGGPVDTNMNPEAYRSIPLIRQALKDENYRLADELNRKVQGRFSESYAPMGTLYLEFANPASPQNYRRELNISDAVSKVSYEANGVEYTREYFVSHPDQLMLIRLTCNKKGALTFEVNFDSPLKESVFVKDNMLCVNGYAPVHAEPAYRGEMANAVVFDENRGTRFAMRLKIKNTDGKLVSTDHSVGLAHGTEALIFVSEATSFNGFENNPATEGVDAQYIAENQLAKALAKSYDELKDSHVADYQNYFDRVSLDLGKTTAPDLPTDERLQRYAKGKEDKNLEVLYFQFGRYLLISSSRTPGVPANLQGIWNPYIRPPWSSNYTLNINLEENYWLAENTNLSEMHQSLLGFIKNLAATGAVTAKTFYGVNKGWVACHNSDIWAMSNPVGDFGQGDPVWACWNMGGTWLSTHLWQHYLFTHDKDYLKNYAYDLMKGAAEFCLGWLVTDKNGELITSPSTSPENKYVTPHGYVGATLYGGTADLAMVRECFRQTIAASKILDLDAEFREKLVTAMDELHPYKIGEKGNLQEW
jgi:alpha-L-fucosidase 2